MLLARVFVDQSIINRLISWYVGFDTTHSSQLMHVLVLIYLIKLLMTLQPQLRLSHEHQGFVFEPNAMKAVDMLLDHSGGKVSKALEMAIGEGEIEYVNGEVCFTDEVADIVDESKVVGHPIDGGTDEPENKGRLFNCFNCC
jgi:hypothetical protein